MATKIMSIAPLIILIFCNTVHSAENIEPTVSAAAASFKAKFHAGEYWSVGSDGMDLLEHEPDNDELRMIVANSLAWTGRYADAISQYQILAASSLSDSAALGLANAYRWHGRYDLASPLYLQILTSQPDNQDAIDGFNRARRMLRPRTAINLGSKSDSNSVVQNFAELNHSWRGDNSALKYGLALNSSRYILTPDETHQKEINFSVEHADMTLAPKLDLSFQQEPSSKAFATLRLTLYDEPNVQIAFGHVNWGNLVFQPRALLAGLTATQIGVTGNLVTYPGTLSAAHNDFQVSDGNRVQDSNLRFSPSWRPLGPDFKYYIGVSSRLADKNVPTYWSPDIGYRSTDIGFSHEWSMNHGEYSIYGQRGFGSGGEALNSYNMGFSAKRYLDRDWAMSMSAGVLENLRTDAYRSNYLTLGVERLW